MSDATDRKLLHDLAGDVVAQLAKRYGKPIASMPLNSLKNIFVDPRAPRLERHERESAFDQAFAYLKGAGYLQVNVERIDALDTDPRQSVELSARGFQLWMGQIADALVNLSAYQQ